MREEDLAAVLFERGVQSGLSMDRVIDELGAINWPSFIDARAFRAALAGAAEAQLRRQMEDQMAMIRRKIGGTPATPSPAYSAPQQQVVAQSVQPVVQHQSGTLLPIVGAVNLDEINQPPNATPTQQPAAQTVPPPATPTPAPPIVGRVTIEETPAEEELPNDATMVWMTHHGQRPKPE